MKKLHLSSATIVALLLVGTAARAETVDVKYRGPVDLKPFACTDTVSSFVHRVCYDEPKRYVIVRLKETYYHYCEMPAGVVKDWLGAESKGRFYNANIKAKFDCRLGPVPTY